MAVRVLVVDDSGFFRRRLTEILSADRRIEVIGTASNGQEAIDKALELRPDVITMDYEMPVMDGISAVKQIMLRCPTPVLMFSSLTHEGARVTLDALEAGAVDYLPKNFEDISRNPQKVRELLCDKVQAISRSNRRGLASRLPLSSGRGSLATASTPPAATPLSRQTRVVRPRVTAPVPPPAATAATPAAAPPVAPSRVQRKAYKLVAIGTSTGGPVAYSKYWPVCRPAFRLQSY